MAYATLEELKGRLDYTLEEEEERVADAALEDASNLAQYYGKAWPSSAYPPLVKTIVLNACVRHMRLIEGLVSSRAGDETLTWTDLRDKTGTVFLDDAQQAQLARLAGTQRGVWSVPLSAYGGSLEITPSGAGHVPVTTGGDLFPFYADGTGRV